MRTVFLSSLLAVAVGCSTARAPSTESQEQNAGSVVKSDASAAADADGGGPTSEAQGHRDTAGQTDPVGAACRAAGGQCLLGGHMGCAQVGPQPCNTTPPNPGGAFCCLSLEARDASAATSVEADSEDASTADADGGSSPQSVDYSCSTNADCEVKDLGSCCGYNPRCVNRRSAVPPVVCPPGAASPCGFPVIDACSCRDQVCRIVQDGREI